MIAHSRKSVPVDPALKAQNNPRERSGVTCLGFLNQLPHHREGSSAPIMSYYKEDETLTKKLERRATQKHFFS
jgi:hypothetical protein